MLIRHVPAALAGLIALFPATGAASPGPEPGEPQFFHGPQHLDHPLLLSVAVGEGDSLVVELRYPHSHGGYRTAIGTGQLEPTGDTATVNDLVGSRTGAVRLRWSEDRGSVTLEWTGDSPPPDFSIDGTYPRLSREQRLERARATHAAALDRLAQTEAELVAAAGGRDLPAAAALQTDQQHWRDGLPASVELAWNGLDWEDPASREDPNFWDLLTDLVQARERFIRLRADPRPLERRTGDWWDGAHGHLIITDPGLEAAGEEVFDFEIHTLRGRGAHVGHISGRAAMTDGTTAVWRDPEPAAFIGGEPAELTFDFDGRRVTVRGLRTQFYHGAAAHFDGEYHHTGTQEDPAAGSDEGSESAGP